jgi:hypothetical protein
MLAVTRDSPTLTSSASESPKEATRSGLVVVRASAARIDHSSA